MKKVSLTFNIGASAEQCFNFVKEGLKDERYIRACLKLFSVEYPAVIIDEKENKSITLQEKGFEPFTKISLGSWKTIYNFFRLSDNTTQIDVTIAYGKLTAFLGFGSMKAQAKSQLVYIINNLIAFEKGMKLFNGIAL